MQLILESESINDINLVNGKMSLDQETVGEKITNGEIHSNGTGDVIKTGKENKECHENVITNEIVTSSDQKDETNNIEEHKDQEIVTKVSDEASTKENGTTNCKKESQNEDIQSEQTKAEIINKNKNNSESKEAVNEVDEKLSECDSLKDKKVSKENDNDDFVLDEPLRFEDDDSLEKEDEDLNPATTSDNINAPKEIDSSLNETSKSKLSDETKKSESQISEMKLNQSETNETISIETQIIEIDSTEVQETETGLMETEENKTDLTEVKENDTDLVEIKENVSDLKEAKESETDLIEFKENETHLMEVKENEMDLREVKENETELFEIKENDTDLIEVKENETELVETKENETDEMDVLDNENDLLEVKENGNASIEVKKTETTVSITQNDEVDSIGNEEIAASEDTSETVKETIEKVEIREKSSDDAMECDISKQEQIKPVSEKAKVSVAESEDEKLATNDNRPETPMECDDIINTSQDGITGDKTSEISKVDDKKADYKSDNDVSEIPSIQEEPAVTGSTDTVDIINECLVATENKIEKNSASDVVSNSNNVDKIKENSEENNKTIEKVTVKIPDSSTECNDIRIISDSEQVKDDKNEPETVDLDEIDDQQDEPVKEKVQKKIEPVCRLSNNLNILSDDEDEISEPAKEESVIKPAENVDKCIDLVDDDDIVLIDEDTTPKIDDSAKKSETDKMDVEEAVNATESTPEKGPTVEKTDSEETKSDSPAEKVNAEIDLKKSKPLLPKDFFKSYKKNLTEMTRNELEEFCILKIVESIIDRSNLNDIRTKLKSMASHIEEHKKKAQALEKQNRDLQVVLKSVQEEQKKQGDAPIAPLRITRSVGMQVLMTEKNVRRKGPITPVNNPGPSNVQNNRTNQQRTPPARQQRNIPVPKLVLANANNTPKTVTPTQTSVRNTRPSSSPTVAKTQSPAKPEKRAHNQCATVDLTDDEPPSKVVQRSSGGLRVVAPHNLIKNAPAPPPASPGASPRKVYIPIVQNGQVRPGGPMMVKNGPVPGPRPRGQQPSMVRVAQFNTGRTIPSNRVTTRHPAPLPDTVKQYQPPNWKALPPAPDLKLSKVENGIVISWKIEGYLEDSYEEIASYQLYAYQETNAPPNTSLWKKIGDVKALPLPMACTLTQFMAGYKYYFAVRAVDIRSRLGPFSLPGSILLLNKNF